MTQSSLEEARRSVLDLRAAPLEGRTLPEAMKAMAEQYFGEVEVRFESVGGARPLARRVEAGLFRIAQEALTNAARHSGAQHVLLRLVASPKEIELSIEDDGKGFDLSKVPRQRYGLIGINERARLLGGTMDLQSDAGVGTRISIRIPQVGRGADRGGGAG